MEDTRLTTTQRKMLQVGVVVLLALFLGVFFFLRREKNEEQPTPKLKNTTVYLQDSKLQVFDDTYSLVEYSDKVSIHYPYLLVTKPALQTTYIYNLDQKKKEKEVKEVLLDYSENNQLYTKGKTTLFNSVDLGVVCQKGFIKSTDEVLCITNLSKDGVPNMLITINLKTVKNRDLDISQTGILTDLKVINNKIYLGEIDLNTNKSRILVDKQPIDVPNIVSLIYEMKQKPYFASFKSELNKNTESYYSIEENKATKQEGNKIYLYR